MMTAPEVVMYAPDKGAGFGQAFRTRGIARAWDALNTFLNAATVPHAPEGVRLVAHRATRWDDDTVAAACADRTVARWGQPHRRHDTGGLLWPSGEPLQGGYLEWDLSTEQLSAAVAFLVDGDPWPKQTLGPVSLHFSVNFLWKDPQTESELPGQRGCHATRNGDLESNLLITLARRTFIQPALWFPFPEGSPGLERHLAFIAPLLPFKLLPRHFRCAMPTRDGAGYRARKLVMLPTAIAPHLTGGAE